VRGRGRWCFDGSTFGAIHFRLVYLALGLALRAPLRIPGGAIGAKAVGIGADRLALATRFGRQGLAVRPQPRLLRRTRLAGLAVLTRRTGAARLAWRQGLAIGAEALLVAATAVATRAEALLVAATAVATGATRTAIAAIATRATGTAGATRTTRAAITAIATGATRATPRATTATALAAEIARRRRQLPADTGSRHLSAARPVVFFGLVFLCADLEAAEATGLVAAIAAGSTRPAAATTATVAAAIPAAAAVTAPAIVAAPALCRCHAVDRVVVFAARDRAMGALFALEHAHQAHFVEAVADDVERFDQPGRAVGLDRQRARDRIDDRIRLLLGRGFGGRLGGGRASLGCGFGITGRGI